MCSDPSKDTQLRDSSSPRAGATGEREKRERDLSLSVSLPEECACSVTRPTPSPIFLSLPSFLCPVSSVRTERRKDRKGRDREASSPGELAVWGSLVECLSAARYYYCCCSSKKDHSHRRFSGKLCSCTRRSREKTCRERGCVRVCVYVAWPTTQQQHLSSCRPAFVET